MSEENSYLGTGWDFPPKFNRMDGGVVMQSGKAVVENSLRLIMQTQLGERILRPEYGSTINDLTFEPVNENLKTYMRTMLKSALEENEPRVAILELNLIQPKEELGRIDITISYALVATGEEANLVVPFYVPENVNIV